MDYMATFPNVFLRFHASNMILNVDSDAAYLVAPKARSRIAGYFQLNSCPKPSYSKEVNGAIMVTCTTLRHVVSSAAEAETAGVYCNAQSAIPIRTILHALNHPQPPTPIKTDNTTTSAFVHDNIQQKRSKSWDMRYHWLRDRSAQNQFDVYWDTGKNSEADYFTKHHNTPHHRQRRSRYVNDSLSHLSPFTTNLCETSPYAAPPCALRGCITNPRIN